MSGVTQESRDGGFKVAGEDDDLLVLKRLSGEEKLGRPYVFHVELSCDDPELRFGDLVGKAGTVWLEYGEDETRYWSGIVTNFRLVGSDRDGNAEYAAELRPWIWLLTKTADCRIFQEMTVPDIIKEVFGNFGFTDYEEEFSGTYRIWKYCVQYRETAFNFVSRLMEQEGIYYYFRHEDGKSVMVLSDGFHAHEQIPGGSIPFSVPSGGVVSGECITQWEVGCSVRSGSVVLNDYDFENPTADLLAERVANLDLADKRGAYEIYDYPGEYVEGADGSAYSEIRLQELQADWSIVTGRADARALGPGVLFDLRDHPRGDQNTEHLLLEARYMLRMPDSSGSSGGASGQYSVAFRATLSENPFRAARITPKPSIQGPQTAVVVGTSGEEIWTDQYGRVKLLFHWDRLGQEKKDEGSSCWVRVSQEWAGKGWGSIHIPRIGQEVIVDFLEGDPDRPIVTGRVYNGDNPVPYTLPDNQTQSGIKTRSTKDGGGDNFNELRFEDKKGEEQVVLHAELDYNRNVEHDESATVGNDRKKEVGNDQEATVGNDDKLDVGNDQTIVIGNDETVTIGNNETRDIGTDETVTIGSNEARTIGTDLSVDVGSNENRKIGSSLTLDVGGDRSSSVGGADALSVNGNHSIEALGKSLHSSAQAIELKCGGSSIKIEPSKITIKAPQVELKGDMTLKLEGGLQAKLKGGLALKAEGGLMAGFKGGLKADLKGLMTGVDGTAMAKIKGAILKVN
ncbi:MAG: type VI secretion system tip protein TssI/VgrG [Planctomycetota bacterium]